MSGKNSILIGSIAALIIGASVAIGATAEKERKEESKKNEKSGSTAAEVRLPLEIAGGTSLNQLSDSSGSWAGGDRLSLRVRSSSAGRRGSIIQLLVRVGQGVSVGDTIAILSSPPASVERADVAAEKRIAH